MTLGSLINHGLKGVAHYKDHKKYRVMQCIHIPVKLKMLILEYIKEVKKKGDQPFYKTGEWKLKVCNCPNELEWSFQKVSSSEASGSPDTGLQADEQTISSFPKLQVPQILARKPTSRQVSARPLLYGTSQQISLSPLSPDSTIESPLADSAVQALVLITDGDCRNDWYEASSSRLVQ
ncbi:hypothetical protein Patl1_14484 [Pistacia atlantica]|uniref:Uncharacterized protein n=1 Tax=Pistacia atlantica TaxID=434234 RepID=A0ACC1AVT4_9ROSI|nr:hypothetical protein Patl1_14484 [Pistacia atlantica]